MVLDQATEGAVPLGLEEESPAAAVAARVAQVVAAAALAARVPKCPGLLCLSRQSLSYSSLLRKYPYSDHTRPAQSADASIFIGGLLEPLKNAGVT